MKIKKMFQGNAPENKILNTRSNSQTDVYSCDYANNNFAVNYVDNEVVPTNEYLNGKRIYAYRYQFSQELTKGTEYIFDLPFADEMDFAWIDLSHSYYDGSKGSENYNVYTLDGGYAGYGFIVRIKNKNEISIKPDDDWGDFWTFTIMVKFTMKNN